MRHWRVGLIVWGMAVVSIIGGCVVLSGQRMAFRYDKAADQLDILLFYDGIHDDPDNASGGRDPVKQLADFVANGDIMLLDWFGHLKLGHLVEEAGAPMNPPAARDFAKVLAEQVKTDPVGHYRDMDGRIGALQIIRIVKASSFIEKANAALNAQIVREGGGDAPTEWRRTTAAMLKAAAAGHQWIALDGSSIVVTLPIDQREWAVAKANFIMDKMLLDIVKRTSKDGQEDATKHIQEFAAILQLLTSAPMSLEEKPNQLVVRLGTPSQPTHLRTRLTGREYNKDLEGVVEAHVKDNLDQRIKAVLLDGKTDEMAEAVIAWGPQELTARVLAQEAVTGNTAAGEKLSAWAAKWNTDYGLPAAPVVEPSDGAAFITAWTHWYDAMAAFPLALPAQEAATKADEDGAKE